MELDWRSRTWRLIRRVYLPVNMIIGIDVNPLTRGSITGTERYVLELVKELKNIPLSEGNKVVLYASAKVDALGELPDNWEWRILKWPFKGWTHLRFGWELIWRAPDILFIPAHEIPILALRSRIITTVHDLAFLQVADIYSRYQVWRQKFSLWQVKWRAEKIIAISSLTKKDLLAYDNFKQDIKVVHLGFDKEYFGYGDNDELRAGVEGENDRYALFVGRIELKKGIDYLIEALSGTKNDFKLILVGKPGFGFEEIKNRINQLNLQDRVEIKGYVNDEELKKLYSGALFFVFPSRFEGFGLPLLEAMSYRLPVLASDIEIMREIGGEAVLLAELENSDDWAMKMDELSNDEDLRNEMIIRGLQRVGDFSWVRTAKETAEILEW